MSRSRDNFVRLAESRTRRALKDIQLIGNLSNRSNYDWDEKDADKMFAALEAELKAARRRFTNGLRAWDEAEFTLSD